MKFSVSSSLLLNELQKAGGAINSNPVIPILEDFLFQIQDGILSIAATNLETSIKTSVEVQADSDWQVAVPAKILMDTLKALPEQPLEFEIDEQNKIKLQSQVGEYNLSGDHVEDFPKLPQEEGVESFELDADIIHEAINKTSFATSNDELRLAMTGVFLQVDFNKLNFVATDAHKLVKYSFNKVSTDTPVSFIIPKKSLTLLKNSLPSNGSVRLAFNKSHVFFSADKLHISCRLIDARFPDYNAVIPTENPNQLVINRVDFLNSLKRIAIYANKTTNQVVLNLVDGSMTISSQDLDFSNEATEQLSCSYDGDSMNIGFNARFLIEMLSVLDSAEVRMSLSSPNRAGIIQPLEQDEGEDLLMLVMPVMMGH